MRSKRSSKASRVVKPSYAERVLGAMTLIQKQSKKAAVHLATLRSQVSKTASARNDELGPQWSSYVGKAVKKLEAHGVIQQQASGTVTLTPGATKSITAARHELNIPYPTPADEDRLWKSLSINLTRRDLKRRRTSGGTFPVGESISTTQAKRPRRSSAKPKKSLSRMTRAELQAELLSLQVHKSGSDHPSNEVHQLRRDLQAREEEIDRAHAELNELRWPDTSSLGTLTPSPRLARTRTPELDSASPTSVPKIRELFGATRTQNGSFISLLSKHPTPAPSEADNNGDFGVSPSSDMNEDVFGTPTRDTIGLLTPLTSPTKAADHLTSHKAIFQRRAADRTTEVHQALPLERFKLREFHGDTGEMDTDLDVQLPTITSRDVEIKHLKELVENNRIALAGSEASKIELAQSLELKEQKLEMAYTSELNTLKAEKDRYVLELAKVQKALDDSSAQARTLESSITRLSQEKLVAQDEAKSLLETKTALCAEAQQTSEKLRDVEVNMSAVEQVRSSLANQLHIFEEQRGINANDLEQGRIMVLGLEATAVEREQMIQKLVSRYDALSFSSTQQEIQVQILEAALSAEKVGSAELQTYSIAERGRAARLQVQVDAKDHLIGELEPQLHEAGEKLLHSEQQIAALQVTISEFEHVSRVELVRTKEGADKLAHTETDLLAQTAILETRTQELADIRSLLVAAQADAHTLVSSLTEAREAQTQSRMAYELKTAELESSLCLSEDKALRLQGHLDTVEASYRESLTEGDMAKAEVVSLHSLLSAETSRIVAMEQNLDDVEKTHRKETSDYQWQITSLNTSLVDAQSVIDLLKTQSTDHTAAARVSARRISTLEVSVGALEGDASQMEQLLDSTQLNLAGVTKQLGERDQEFSCLRGELELEQGRVLTLGAELERAHASVAEAEDRVTGLVETKTRNEETIRRVTNGYAKLRQVQTDCFTEMDRTVLGAGQPGPSREQLD